MTLQKTRSFILSKRNIMIGKYWIDNANRERLGYFTGELKKLGREFLLRDLQDEENPLMTILEKRIKGSKHIYEFYKGGEGQGGGFIGTIIEKYRYWFVDLMENKLFEMDGDIWRWKYIIFSGKRLARVYEKLFKGLLPKRLIENTYGVQINPNLDDDTAMLVLSFVVMLHYERKYKQNQHVM